MEKSYGRGFIDMYGNVLINTNLNGNTLPFPMFILSKDKKDIVSPDLLKNPNANSYLCSQPMPTTQGGFVEFLKALEENRFKIATLDISENKFMLIDTARYHVATGKILLSQALSLITTE
jgi:hypothetical protein